MGVVIHQVTFTAAQPWQGVQRVGPKLRFNLPNVPDRIVAGRLRLSGASDGNLSAYLRKVRLGSKRLAPASLQGVKFWMSLFVSERFATSLSISRNPPPFIHEGVVFGQDQADSSCLLRTLGTTHPPKSPKCSALNKCSTFIRSGG